MRGGTYLGSGTYGCIFYPSIKCKTGEQHSGVGKIFNDIDEFEDEKKMGYKMKQIDNNANHFNIPTASCNITKEDVEENNTNKSCPHTTSKNQKEFYQIVYKEKGTDLEKYVRETLDIELFDKKTVKHINQLIDAVRLLEDNSLVHLDIKLPNVLISTTEKLLLIDFGLTCKFEELYMNGDSILEYSYEIFPPEFKVYLILKLIKSKLKVTDTYYEDLKTIIMKEFKKLDDFEGYIPITFKPNLTPLREKQFESFVDSLIKHLKENKKTHRDSKFLFDHFTNVFARKVDVFAVGALLSRLTQLKKVNLENLDKLDKLRDLLENVHNMNPYERYTINRLKNEFNNIINEENTKTPVEQKKTPKKPSVSKYKVMTMEECKKKKVIEIKELVKSSKLDKKNKKIKYLPKEKMCKHLIQHLSNKSNTKPNDKSNTKPNDVTIDQCEKYFALTELKKVVDEKNLPKKLKQLNKKELCNQIHSHLDISNKNLKTVKRGKKKTTGN